MEISKFIDEVINQGIAGARESYKEGDPKLKGSIEGFEACRGKTPKEIGDLLNKCSSELMQYYDGDVDLYWEKNCFRLEVEWVCNCLSAVFYNQGEPVIITPTYRGMLQAARIVGVREEPLPNSGEEVE